MSNRRQRRVAASQARRNQAVAPPPASLTEQAAADLAQGVACHQRGDAAAARAHYQAVLAASPDSIDAHNLLGVLLHQTGDLDAAAEHAEQAVALHQPSPELHYNLGNIRRDQHRLAEAADCFRKAADLNPDYFEAIYNLAIVLQHLGQNTAAIDHLERALRLEPNVAIGHCLLADLRLARGEVDHAIAAYRRAIEHAPDFAEAHNNLAVALRQTGDDTAARGHLDRALAAKPDYVDAHINLALVCQDADPEAAARHFATARDLAAADPRPHLGLAGLLHNQGRFDAAIAAYQAGLAAAPGTAALHNNLGTLYRDMGRAADAVAAYRQALAIDPALPEAGLNLAHALRDRGEIAAAVDAYAALLTTAPGDDAVLTGLATALSKIAPTVFDPDLHALVAACFASDAVRHQDLATVAAALLRLRCGPAWTAGDSAVAAWAADPVALGLLHRAVNVDPSLEPMLADLRRFLLGQTDPSPDAVRLMAAVAVQAHNTAYVLPTTKDEDARITVRANSLGQSPSIADVLAVAMYRPLPDVPLPDDPAPWWHEFVARAIDAPAAERVLADAIPVLGGPVDMTSREVRDQYEADPYPRWLALRTERQVPLARRLALVNPAMPVPAGATFDAILVAGCGTGQQPIQVARANPAAQVVAVDLSRRSLAYAARMAGAAGVDNIRFAQADILDLTALDRTFPVVECVGVLHHMADPAAGLAAVVERLAAGGYLRLGLYSKVARGHIIAAQQLTRALPPTPANIRDFRQQLLAETDRPPNHPTRISDFFDLSGCRDLLFHVQEHNFLLPEVAALIGDAGLAFVGFDFEDPAVVAAFRATNPAPHALADLDAWAAFEADHPTTFIGMYQFWCRRQ